MKSIIVSQDFVPGKCRRGCRTSFLQLGCYAVAISLHYTTHFVLIQFIRLPCVPCRGESGWCLDMTSTHGAWRHAEVQFLLPGACLSCLQDLWRTNTLAVFCLLGPNTILCHPGHSSVGRASDCRLLQQSDGPWFDSGWPDLPNYFLNAKSWCTSQVANSSKCYRGFIRQIPQRPGYGKNMRQQVWFTYTLWDTQPSNRQWRLVSCYEVARIRFDFTALHQHLHSFDVALIVNYSFRSSL